MAFGPPLVVVFQEVQRSQGRGGSALTSCSFWHLEAMSRAMSCSPSCSMSCFAFVSCPHADSRVMPLYSLAASSLWVFMSAESSCRVSCNV